MKSSPIIRHMTSATKYQTRTTFLELLRHLSTVAKERRIDLDLAADQPVVLVVDNASSHCGDFMESMESSNFGKLAYKFKEDETIIVFYTLPRRTHTLQSGDQMINKSLRAYTRRQAKLRVLQHTVAVHQGIKDIRSLDFSEVTARFLHHLFYFFNQWNPAFNENIFDALAG
jgi:hypothetical protein